MVIMNLDNQRLVQIQQEKNAYGKLLANAETISDCIHYQTKIDELESEETDILKRCDVRI